MRWKPYKAATRRLITIAVCRAPSYISTSKNSYFQADDDEEALITHGRSTSYSEPSKAHNSPVVRVISQTPTARVKRDRRRKLQGWRFGVAVSAWVAFLCLMLNLLFTVSASIKFRKSMVDGVGTAYEGSCDVVDTWATWVHILINALSSILLSASNYTMQCLSSPTRKEIDRAHSKGDWVDIGVASVRNIFGRISRRRTGLWYLLSLSSIPIHLLYNSAIFKTLDANIYVSVPSRCVDLRPMLNENLLCNRTFWSSIRISYKASLFRLTLLSLNMAMIPGKTFKVFILSCAVYRLFSRTTPRTPTPRWFKT